MSDDPKANALTRELKRLELRAEDRGKIKGEFEVHFGVKLDKNLVITQELCGKWNVRCCSLIKNHNIEPNQESPELDRLFQRFFNAQLSPGKHLTPEMCYGWRDKHQGYLMGIWLKRSRSKQNPNKTDGA